MSKRFPLIVQPTLPPPPLQSACLESVDRSGQVLLGETKSLKLLGGILGNQGNNSASIATGNIGSLWIGSSLQSAESISGGSGSASGKVSIGDAKSVFFSGDISGGSGTNSGFVVTGTVGDFTLRGDLNGGTNVTTGYLSLDGVKGKLTVNGNVSGASNVNDSGCAAVFGNAKSIEINGDLRGGTASMASIQNSGLVLVTGNAKSLVIGGNILGGGSTNPDTSYNLGAVRAGTIGDMVVKGNVFGTSTQNVFITAQGNTALTSGSNLAIKSLTVYGAVDRTTILGGYDTSGSTLNGNGGTNGGGAQLGTIKILNGFSNSSIATGVSNNNAMPNHWADNNNTLLSTNSIVASIAKIVINGPITATVQNGIVAEKVLSLSVNGLNIPISFGHTQIGPTSLYVDQLS